MLCTLSQPGFRVLGASQRVRRTDTAPSSFSNGKTWVSTTDKSRKKNTTLTSSEQSDHPSTCPSAFMNFRYLGTNLDLTLLFLLPVPDILCHFPTLFPTVHVGQKGKAPPGPTWTESPFKHHLCHQTLVQAQYDLILLVKGVKLIAMNLLLGL